MKPSLARLTLNVRLHGVGWQVTRTEFAPLVYLRFECPPFGTVVSTSKVGVSRTRAHLFKLGHWKYLTASIYSLHINVLDVVGRKQLYIIGDLA